MSREKLQQAQTRLRQPKDRVAQQKEQNRAWKAEIKKLRSDKKLLKTENTKLRANADALIGVSEPSITAQLRLRHAPPVHEPMLLISQVQRSGGTLLAQLFDGHPECLAHPYELKWGRPLKWDWPEIDLEQDVDTTFSSLQQKWLVEFARQGFYQKQVQGRAQQEIQYKHPFLFDLALQKTIFTEQVKHASHQRDVLDAYLTSFFDAWLDYQGAYGGTKRYVVAFTPRVHMEGQSLARFFGHYPDGVLLSVIRDPAAWYASAMKHRFAHDRADFDSLLDLWRRSTESTLDAKHRYGDHVQLVVFEELLTRPEATTLRICRGVGLEWDPCMLRPTFNNMEILSDSSFVPARGIDDAAAQRYMEVQPETTIETIRSTCGDLYSGAVAAVHACSR